jgi:hypothetical protein
MDLGRLKPPLPMELSAWVQVQQHPQAHSVCVRACVCVCVRACVCVWYGLRCERCTLLQNVNTQWPPSAYKGITIDATHFLRKHISPMGTQLPQHMQPVQHQMQPSDQMQQQVWCALAVQLTRPPKTARLA